jgi:hypothetical protein
MGMNGMEQLGSLKTKKSKFQPSADKVIIMNFWNHQGALHIKFIHK